MMMRLLPLVPVFALAVACTIDTSDPAPRGGRYVPPTTEDGTPVDTATPQLVRAVVDTDQRMSNVIGGEGVGVFIEYQSGGSWRVRWTCDSARTRQACNYKVRVAASAILEPQAEGGASISSSGTKFVSLTTATSYDVQGVSFATDPGEVITLEVEVDGVKTGAYVFFVQDGKVNGGYEGKLSNPIELVPSAP